MCFEYIFFSSLLPHFRLDFRSAFTLVRKHRIDVNIIYDHNPPKFMEHVETFVRQLKDPDYLNLFLFGLKDEDVTKTMYRGLKESATLLISELSK